MAHVKRAAAFGAIKLVRRKGSQIEIGAIDVKRHLAQRLHRVRVEEHAAFAAEPPDLFNGLEHTGFIVGRHDADQNRPIGECVFELIKIDEAVTADGQVGYPAAAFFQVLAAIEHRLVLGDGGDDVVAFFATGLPPRL